MRRLRKNKVAMVSLLVILGDDFRLCVPSFYPYKLRAADQGRHISPPMHFSADEQAQIAAGAKLFPHILGTDNMGRDYAIRVMVGSRISLLVGIIASAIILLIGSIYGSVAGYFGGRTDLIMMRIVDIIYTVPDILLIILLSMSLKAPLEIWRKSPAGPGSRPWASTSSAYSSSSPCSTGSAWPV
jgi:oligopeptide transport system permease protein